MNLNLFLIPLTLIFGILCIIISLWVMIAGIKKQSVVARSLGTALLLVLAPIEREKENDTLEKLRERIAVMEQFFAGITTMKENSKWKKFFIGDPHISFEIATINGQVRFMIGVSEKYKDFVEKQLLGVFPDAKIEEMAEDYTIFSEQCAVAASIGSLSKLDAYPIKTYKKLESDSLGGITNAFSKIKEMEGAAIQILIKPAHKRWEKQGIEMAKKIREGKPVEISNVAKDIGKGVLKKLGGMALPVEAEKEPLKPAEPVQQFLIEMLENKANQHGFLINLRIVAAAETKERAASILDNIEGAFAQFKLPSANSFKFKKKFFPKNKSIIWQYIFRAYSLKNSFILGSEELASIFHMPLIKDIKGVKRLDAKQAALPANIPKEGIVLGNNIYRGVSTPVRIKKSDRRRHAYIIGKTGTGKTVFLENLITQDIENGEGVCVIDPHGELIEKVLAKIPKERAEDVIVFDPANAERPLGFNLFESPAEGQKDLISLEAMSIFIKLFGSEIFGPRIQDYFRNGALTLMSDDENPGTIIDIVRLFTDDEFQEKWVAKIKNPIVKNFWTNQMAKTGAREKQEIIPFLAAKFGAFITNSTMRNIIGQSHSAFNFREVMDQGKILLVSLSKGTVGEINMSLLGMIIVAKLQMAAMSRSDIQEDQRRDFYLYVDEFQNFATSSFESILSEARKYKLNLIIAHQYLAQIENVGGDFEKKIDLRKSVFGNVGTMVVFRTGVEDAEIFEKEFLPIFDKQDISNIENLNAYVKLLIDGISSPAFNMHVPFPKKPENLEIARLIKEFSSLRFGKSREIVEKEIFERLG